MAEIKPEDLQKLFGSPVIAAGKDKDGFTIYNDAKSGERRYFSGTKGVPIKDKAGNTVKDEKGDILYQDEVTGSRYTVGEHKWREEAIERKKQKEEEKRIQEKIQDDTRNIKLEEPKFMADENVTKFDVLKDKVETLKEDTKNKLLEREKFDEELEHKVDALDKKQCQGEECYTRIEKNQVDAMKMLEDRLKRLEEPVYVCSNCNIGTMRKGATECPYCEVKVKTWS